MIWLEWNDERQEEQNKRMETCKKYKTRKIILSAETILITKIYQKKRRKKITKFEIKYKFPRKKKKWKRRPSFTITKTTVPYILYDVN